MPTTPVSAAVYLWYFHHVLPRIGRCVSRHDAAYAYLPASVGAFASPDEFVKILRQAGFVDVRAVPLTFGIVYLYTATRGAEPGVLTIFYAMSRAPAPVPPAILL